MSIEQKGKIVKIILLLLGALLIFLLSFFIIKIYTAKYTVTFANEDNTVIETKEVQKGKTVIVPADPQKEGYIFKGWYYDNHLFDFKTKINQNITIFAKWEINSEYIFSYVVTFDSNGGSNVDYQTVQEGKAAIKPADPTKNGHIFVGWQLDENDYNFDVPVTEDIKLVAKWEVALNEDQTNLEAAKAEIQNFAVVVANQKLKESAVDGKCSITWTDANFEEVVRDATNKTVTVVANITCGKANAKKKIVVTIPASTYKYTMEKQTNTTYKFTAFDNENTLKDYNLYNANVENIQYWQTHKDGNYLQISSSKYVKNGVYYIAFTDDLNTKYAVTLK